MSGGGIGRLAALRRSVFMIRDRRGTTALPLCALDPRRGRCFRRACHRGTGAPFTRWRRKVDLRVDLLLTTERTPDHDVTITHQLNKPENHESSRSTNRDKNDCRGSDATTVGSDALTRAV